MPETKYARCGKLHIAYQVIGEGPPDLVFVPGIVSHLEYQWEDPTQAAFFRRLASFSRLIRFDKRGAGLSDRVEAMPTLEERMDDVRAVMDAVGSKRAALLGLSEGGPMSSLFAATYPERTSALILWNTWARVIWDKDYPEGIPLDWAEKLADGPVRNWGTGESVPLFVLSSSEDEQFRNWWGQFERLAMSPGAAIEAIRINVKIDVRQVLPLIRSPTLVINNAGDQMTPTAMIRYMAERIPGAKYVELPGIDHFAWREEDGVTEEIEEFLTGSRHYPDRERVLATVLFTDIVGSTDRVAELGDRGWRKLLDHHDTIVRRQIERYRGRLVDSAGDGVFATFDGPARSIRCACAIGEEIRDLGIEIRAGLHTGEVEVRGEGLAGIAVHIGARIAALASPQEVLVSSTVRDLVAGSGISFSDRGWHELKGVPEKWRLFSVEF